MQSRAATVDQYLADLPDDRRAAVEAVRAVIRKNLPKGYEERMAYGMIGWGVPHSLYPAGYHCDPRQPLPFVGLASQKGHLSLYLMAVYLDPELEGWFRGAWKKSGHKLDMGKACIRFKSADDVPLDVIGEAIRRVPVATLISRYEKVVGPRGKTAEARPPVGGAPSRGSSARKPATAGAKGRGPAKRTSWTSAPPKSKSKPAPKGPASSRRPR